MIKSHTEGTEAHSNIATASHRTDTTELRCRWEGQCVLYVIYRYTNVSALLRGDSHAAGENNETVRETRVGMMVRKKTVCLVWDYREKRSGNVETQTGGRTTGVLNSTRNLLDFFWMWWVWRSSQKTEIKRAKMTETDSRKKGFTKGRSATFSIDGFSFTIGKKLIFLYVKQITMSFGCGFR